MNIGDPFTHNGIDYLVHRVLSGGRVQGKAVDANIAPTHFVIAVADITP